MNNGSLAEAIREAYEGQGLSQVQVAQRMGVDQTRISRLSLGKWSEDRGPDPDTLARIEAAAERPRGWILVRAGYVDAVQTVPEAAAHDPALDNFSRGHLIAYYRGLVESLQESAARGDLSGDIGT